MYVEEDLVLYYEDNGKGIDKNIKDPYSIFKYGVTTKVGKNGETYGTGLGMYIIESTLREYNAKFKILKYRDGFGLELRFPL